MISTPWLIDQQMKWESKLWIEPLSTCAIVMRYYWALDTPLVHVIPELCSIRREPGEAVAETEKSQAYD